MQQVFLLLKTDTSCPATKSWGFTYYSRLIRKPEQHIEVEFPGCLVVLGDVVGRGVGIELADPGVVRPPRAGKLDHGGEIVE